MSARSFWCMSARSFWLTQSDAVDEIHEDLVRSAEVLSSERELITLDVEDLVLRVRAEHDVAILSKNGPALTESQRRPNIFERETHILAILDAELLASLTIELDEACIVTLLMTVAVATEDKQHIIVDLAQTNVDHGLEVIHSIGHIQVLPALLLVACIRVLFFHEVRLVVEKLDAVEEFALEVLSVLVFLGVEAAKNEYVLAAESYTRVSAARVIHILKLPH